MVAVLKPKKLIALLECLAVILGRGVLLVGKAFLSPTLKIPLYLHVYNTKKRQYGIPAMISVPVSGFNSVSKF